MLEYGDVTGIIEVTSRESGIDITGVKEVTSRNPGKGHYGTQ